MKKCVAVGDDRLAQTPRFSAEAEVVTVDVVVLDESGDPIEGLRPEDFTVTDEGRVRPLSRFEAVTLPDAPEPEDHEVRFVSTNASAGGHRCFGPTTLATARYSNYRRFSVTVDTEARLPHEWAGT